MGTLQKLVSGDPEVVQRVKSGDGRAPEKEVAAACTGATS
jgi:hypothetical protein